MADIAPYSSAIVEMFRFLEPLSAAFVTMITERLAANRSKREQFALDKRIRRVQRQIKSELKSGLPASENAAMIANKVGYEFGQSGDTQQMRTEITNQFNFELLNIPIPVTG